MIAAVGVENLALCPDEVDDRLEKGDLPPRPDGRRAPALNAPGVRIWTHNGEALEALHVERQKLFGVLEQDHGLFRRPGRDLAVA
jgi:hypothetical protein